jgi:hypothetical protein
MQISSIQLCAKRTGVITIALLAVVLTSEVRAKTFHDATCSKDCGGHKAGYEWARKKGISAPEQCGGKSNSFTEGCRIWAEEHQAPSDAHSDDKKVSIPRPGS